MFSDLPYEVVKEGRILHLVSGFGIFNKSLESISLSAFDSQYIFVPSVRS